MESKFRILVVGILCVFLCGVVFSQGTSTAGTAVRHRDVLMGVQVITLGVAMSLRKDMKISRDEQMNRIRG